MLALVNEVPAPSRILTQRFSVRPRKTIHHCHPAVFPPSTALCKRLNSEYLLFLIGFAYYTVFLTPCQCFIMLNCIDAVANSRTTNRFYACLFSPVLYNPVCHTAVRRLRSRLCRFPNGSFWPFQSFDWRQCHPMRPAETWEDHFCFNTIKDFKKGLHFSAYGI